MVGVQKCDDYPVVTDGPLGRIKRKGDGTETITYLHTDHQGTARAGTDAAGVVQWEDFHTPFGDSLIAPAANDNQSDDTGHIRDTGSGLTYMQARYYDPVVGRFLSVDPVTFMDTGDAGYFNRYAYTMNDPVNNIDQDGQACAPCLPIGAAIILNQHRRGVQGAVAAGIVGVGLAARNGSSPGRVAVVGGKFATTGYAVDLLENVLQL